MKLDDMTIGEAKQLASMFCNKTEDHPFEIGAVYLIRTVIMIDTGRLLRVMPTELVLEDAAWIADTGRFSDALKKLSFNEVEPFPDGEVIIGRMVIANMNTSYRLFRHVCIGLAVVSHIPPEGILTAEKI